MQEPTPYRGWKATPCGRRRSGRLQELAPEIDQEEHHACHEHQLRRLLILPAEGRAAPQEADAKHAKADPLEQRPPGIRRPGHEKVRRQVPLRDARGEPTAAPWQMRDQQPAESAPEADQAAAEQDEV